MGLTIPVLLRDRVQILFSSPLQAVKDVESLQIGHLVANYTHSPLLTVHLNKIRHLPHAPQPGRTGTRQTHTQPGVTAEKNSDPARWLSLLSPTHAQQDSSELQSSCVVSASQPTCCEPWVTQEKPCYGPEQKEELTLHGPAQSPGHQGSICKVQKSHCNFRCSHSL